MQKKSAQPARVNFIFGEEDFRREEEIEKVSSFVSCSQDAEVISKDAVEAGADALSEAMTGSLFSTARHVIIRRAEELKSQELKALTAKLTDSDACPLPDGTYVSVSFADRKFPPAGIKLPKSANWVELKECKKVYEKDAREFIREYSKQKGFELTPDGIDAIIARLGTDLSLISSEIEKLITYMGSGGSKASGDDVRGAIGEAAHEGLSDLTAAVSAGNSSRSMFLVRQLRESSEPRIPNQLMMAALASDIRLMIAMQEKLSSGLQVMETVRDIKAERMLRTPDFILERAVNTARRIGPVKASKMLLRLGEADRQMKGGAGLSDTVIGEDAAFESALLDLCIIVKGR